MIAVSNPPLYAYALGDDFVVWPGNVAGKLWWNRRFGPAAVSVTISRSGFGDLLDEAVAVGLRARMADSLPAACDPRD